MVQITTDKDGTQSKGKEDKIKSNDSPYLEILNLFDERKLIYLLTVGISFSKKKQKPKNGY